MKAAGTTEKPKNLAQIARMLGVTTGSVSLALRGSEMVSDELKQRVHGLVSASGFKTRSYTRRQPRKTENDTAPVGKIAILYREDPADPVTNTIMRSVAKRLTERKVSFGMFLRDNVMKNPSLLDGFDGFLYDYAWKPGDSHLIEGKPQVAIMNDEVDLGSFDSFKPDDREAGKIAAAYLIGRRPENIFCVWETHAVHKADRNQRLQGFRWEMRDNNAPFTEIEYDKLDGLPQLTAKLRRHLVGIDGSIGIFCFCDQVVNHVCTALDFLEIKRETGKVELISCDNTYLSRQIVPPIPVVDLHIEEIAERAVDGLFWRMEHPDATFSNTLLKPELVLPPTQTN